MTFMLFEKDPLGALMAPRPRGPVGALAPPAQGTSAIATTTDSFEFWTMQLVERNNKQTNKQTVIFIIVNLTFSKFGKLLIDFWAFSNMRSNIG